MQHKDLSTTSSYNGESVSAKMYEQTILIGKYCQMSANFSFSSILTESLPMLDMDIEERVGDRQSRWFCSSGQGWRILRKHANLHQSQAGRGQKAHEWEVALSEGSHLMLIKTWTDRGRAVKGSCCTENQSGANGRKLFTPKAVWATWHHSTEITHHIIRRNSCSKSQGGKLLITRS